MVSLGDRVLMDFVVVGITKTLKGNATYILEALGDPKLRLSDVSQEFLVSEDLTVSKAEVDLTVVPQFTFPLRKDDFVSHIDIAKVKKAVKDLYKEGN